MVEILFVDDEPQILSALRRVFRRNSEWTCHFAQSPREALEVIAEHPITVLVSDHQMPQMTGAEFLSRVKDKRPNMIRIMLTGQADLQAVKTAVNEGQIFRFVLKPWDDDQLYRIVNEAVEYHQVTAENRRLTELAKQQNTKLAELNASLEETVRLRTGQLSDALHTARAANKTLEESLLLCGTAFFSLVELAKPVLGAHSRRVAEHCKGVGQLLGLKEKELAELEMAALLHDIGKVGLPAFMLEKSVEDYTHEELDIYRLHAINGAESLSGLTGYENISSFIKGHHERYDGSGFPLGLEGSDVPQQAYIIGLLDEYDHLVNQAFGNADYKYQLAFQRLAEMNDRAIPSKLVQPTLNYIDSLRSRNRTEEETRLSVSSLRPGVQLSRDIYTMSGSLLLAKGACLTASGVNRIRSIARIDPILGDIYITTRGSIISKDTQAVSK